MASIHSPARPCTQDQATDASRAVASNLKTEQMNDDLRIFKTIVSHKVKVTGNKVELFNESNTNDSSITDLNEQEIVKWLFDNYDIRNVIVEEICGLSTKDIFFKLEVTEPLLNKKEQQIIGDIDAVIIPKNNPEHTVIIEFKRIKVSTLKDESVKTNKISTTRKKGFSQIKKLRKFNYFKTYLGVIIEDDARNVESANTVIRHSKDAAVDSIYKINNENKLENKAGLFFIEMTQPTGENFKSRFNFGLTVEKNADEIEQSNLITERINELLKQ